MNRFEKKKNPRLTGRLLSCLVFLAALGLLLLGMRDISGMTERQEAEGLEDSVRRCAVHCYALEGFYPDSLGYLEDHYGLTYDKDKYIISYEIIGSNLMPDVSVLRIR